MTKKALLGISAFLNLCLLVYTGYITYSTWASLQSGNQSGDLSTGFAALGAAIVMIVFGIATAILLVGLIFKLIAVKVEHNAITFFAMLFDIALVVFAVAINQNAFAEIIAGNVAENAVQLAIVGVVALPFICDLVSFPLESSK